MSKIDVAGLKIDALTKRQLLTEMGERVKSGQKTWVTTPYSEFLYASLKDQGILDLLNKSDFAVADGIGIFWAAKFLQIPLTAKSYFGKVLQAFWQAVYSLAAILFYPYYIKSALPEKIPGSDLIWDIAALAVQNNRSVYLLGGYGDTPGAAADQLISRSANQLKIAGYSSKDPSDLSAITDIQKSGADILLVAYGPIKQEQWIAQHKEALPCKLLIGLGGTFDYIAGAQTSPPQFVRTIGLEWLWRLFTQPQRAKRIWQATAGLVTQLMRYKVFMSYPYRKNVVCVILNSGNKVLICERNAEDHTDAKFGYKREDVLGHWQFPQGGMDTNETVEQTAVRESFEELGLKNLEIFKVSAKKNFYFWPNAQRGLLMRQSEYKGQEQSIVYLKFEGSDSEIKVDGQEFIHYKWVTLNELANSVHPQRLPVAKIVLEDLTEYINL